MSLHIASAFLFKRREKVPPRIPLGFVASRLYPTYYFDDFFLPSPAIDSMSYPIRYKVLHARAQWDIDCISVYGC